MVFARRMILQGATSLLAMSCTLGSVTQARGANKSAPSSAAKSTAKTKATVSTIALSNNSKRLFTQWDTLSNDEWPAPTDAIRVDSIGKQILVFRQPSNRASYVQLDEGKSAAGPIVFLALGRQGDWIRVLLPYLPNGSVGWVRVGDVRFYHVAYRVVVEKDKNLMSIETDNGPILATKVSTGTNNTPTPTGLFYVREIVTAKDQKGPFGPVVLGLSGLSTSLKTFDGGFSRLAIHGTNEPGALGTDASKGCVRLDNVTLMKVSKLLPLGTPVEIVRTRTELIKGRRPSIEWINSTLEEAVPEEETLDTVPPATQPPTELPTPTTLHPDADPNPDLDTSRT